VTLADEEQRRRYDHLYHSSARLRPQPSGSAAPQGPASPSKPAQDKYQEEAAQIAALRKLKVARDAAWAIDRRPVDSTVHELRCAILQLQLELHHSTGLAAADAAANARKNSWRAWLFSPFRKRVHKDEAAVIAREARERQEIKIVFDRKKRTLVKQQDTLRVNEALLEGREDEVKTLNDDTEKTIRAIQERMMVTEEREREARESFARERRKKEAERARADAERQAKLRRRQREHEERTAKATKEATRKRKDADEIVRLEKLRCQQRKIFQEQGSTDEDMRHALSSLDGELECARRRYAASMTYHSSVPDPFATPGLTIQSSRSKASTTKSVCSHNQAWRYKFQARENCPECGDEWAYTIECSGCGKEACARCRAPVHSQPQ
jgi:hypothetical protein